MVLKNYKSRRRFGLAGMNSVIVRAMKRKIRPLGKVAFLHRLTPQANILDVGCGNNSPAKTKSLLPQSSYTGIDIQDYNQTEPNVADEYIIASPARFAEVLAKLPSRYDAVISTHNLEHCQNREAVLTTMLDRVKTGGYLYLSFPCSESVGFPSRTGTLNYYDDGSHVGPPPDFDAIISKLKASGFEVKVEARRHSPCILRGIGMITEPLSRCFKKVLWGTWEFYGFESVIIAKKL